MNRHATLLFLVFLNLHAISQEFIINKIDLSDTASLAMEMQNLSEDYLLLSKKRGMNIEANDRYKIEILAGEYGAALHTIESLRKNTELNNGHPAYIPFELFAKAKIKQLKSATTFKEAYQSVFKVYIMSCNDEQAYSANIVFTTYQSFRDKLQKYYRRLYRQ